MIDTDSLDVLADLFRLTVLDVVEVQVAVYDIFGFRASLLILPWVMPDFCPPWTRRFAQEILDGSIPVAGRR